MDDLKEYCKYLIDEYLKINPRGENSGVYRNLNQFYEEGRIKDLIYSNSKIHRKVEMLEILKDKIVEFSKLNRINVDIDTFEDFQLRLSSPEEYLMKKRSKKYNI